MKRLLFLNILIICSLRVLSQVSVEASISPIEMLVGEQATVIVTVTYPEGATAQLPVFTPMQQLIKGVEILSSRELGVHSRDNGIVERTVAYTLTSFDDTLYYLPPFVVAIDGKNYESKSLALKVLTVEVDTLHAENFYGPKGVQDNPFVWSEWRIPFILSIFMLMLMTLGYYLYIRMRDNKPLIRSIRIVKRLLPHQKAMNVINQLRQERIDGNQESQKEYYTKLTETLRRYIEERYGFSAMEMTSSEIIERLVAAENTTSLNELRQLFQTADLVKFAKYSTLINENDANLMNAVEFINETKLEHEVTEQVVQSKISREELHSEIARKNLKTAIIVIVVVCVLMFCYISYHIANLVI